MLSNAVVFCAFSEKELLNKIVSKVKNLTSDNFASLSSSNSGYNYALKGQNIIRQDNVLFTINTMIISPERA